MTFQYATKTRSTQRTKLLHRIPLNIPKKYYQMPYISMEKYPTFFGNTSKDVKHQLFKFNSECDVFKISENTIK